MNTLAERLAALDMRKASKSFRNANEVRDTQELRRVFALPKRTYLSPEEAATFASQLTEQLKRPGGTMALRPIQAQALLEIHDTRGFLGSLRVGAGKTGVTALALPMLQRFAPELKLQKAVLFVPAALVRKTQHEFEAWQDNFVIPTLPQILSYEWLSRVTAEKFFEVVQPELVICDEVHRLKNKNAACTRRVARYFAKPTKAHPHTPAQAKALFVGMSGTVTKRSLMDFAHLSEWATRHTGFHPLPREYIELQAWCSAVDEKVEDFQRYAPGALLPATTKSESPGAALIAARTIVADRIQETPGFLSTRDDVVPIAITIDFDKPKPSKAIEAALTQLRTKWVTPTGTECVSPVEVWRHEREIALGFCYRWVQPGPKNWLEARTKWGRAVRTILGRYSLKLDSPFAIERAIKQGDIKDTDVLQAHKLWAEIKDAFEPETEPFWICEEPLKQIAERTRNGELVWLEHRAIGARLEEDFGVAYHASKGLDAQGRMIESKNTSHKVAVSVASCSTGRNLQVWSKNYISCPMPQGAAWEQLIGRTHRDGQQADEVSVTVRIGCTQNKIDFEQARADASYIEGVQGQPQKLSLATYAEE